MEITRIGGKGFSVTAALCELRLKRSLRHFSPLWQSSLSISSLSSLTHSLTIFPFILPTAFHLHCFHLLQRPTSEFNSTVWFIICLFISLFLVTHTIYLAFFTLVPNSLKALFFSFTLSSLPFSVSLKGDKFLSFSPSLHPFWLSCSVCLSSFTVTAPWLCWTNKSSPPSVSDGHTLNFGLSLFL